MTGYKYLIYNDHQARFVDGLNNKREAIKRAKQLEQSLGTITITTYYGGIIYETHKAKAE